MVKGIEDLIGFECDLEESVREAYQRGLTACAAGPWTPIAEAEEPEEGGLFALSYPSKIGTRARIKAWEWDRSSSYGSWENYRNHLISVGVTHIVIVRLPKGA